MNEKILKQIKSLPPLPKTVIEVQRITSDPNSSIKDLVAIIKEDPMLTANLLKAANSPLYGFTRQIKSVDQAVSLFGMTTIRGFVISFAIRNSMKFDLSAYGIDENRFHDVSIMRNSLAFNWYRKKGGSKLDIISTDAFLIDLGAVIISLVLNSENMADEFKKRLNKNNREELEKEFVDSTTYEITAEIFKHWHFGEDLIEPVKFINSPENAPTYKEEAAALNVIKTIYDLLEFSEEDIKKGFELAEKYNLDTNELNKALEKINQG
jgi:HD-like signal output (HDOD) protein